MIQLKLTNEGLSTFTNTTNYKLTLTHFVFGSSYDDTEQAIQDESPVQFNIDFQEIYLKGQTYQRNGNNVVEQYNHVKVIGYFSADNVSTFDENGEYLVKEIALMGSTTENANICLAYGYDVEGVKLYKNTNTIYTVKLDLIFDKVPNISVNNSVGTVTYRDFLDHVDKPLNTSNPVHGLTYVNNRLYINGSPLVIDVSGVKNTSFNGAIGISEEVEVLPSASTETTGKVVIDKETGTMSQVVEVGGVKSWQTLYPLLTQINAMSFLPLRQDNTTYAIGDVVKVIGLSTFQYLECVVAGTTGATIPVYANVGELVTDGTVKWLVLDLRDSAPVGTIRQDIIKRDGWLKLNGATINVADYPRLVSFLTANSLIHAYTVFPVWTDFTYGDSNNETLLLPNFEGLFIENSARDTLHGVSAGLPNITGATVLALLHTGTFGKNQVKVESASGVFSSNANWEAYPVDKTAINTSTVDTSPKRLNFNASQSNSIYGNSNTVQPPAVKLIPVIKY